MCRTGMCRFGIGNWIFLLATLHLFTCAQGGDDADEGIRFVIEPSDAVVVSGDSALLACMARAGPARAAGRPPAPTRLAWRHSATAPPTRDHGLSPTDKYRKQLPNGSLVIEGMSGELAGRYQCVAAADGLGTVVSRVATVLLAELPEVAVGPRSILGVAGSPVLVPCLLRAAPPLALRVLSAGAGAGPPDRRVYGAAKVHTPPPTLKLNVTWLKNGSPLSAGVGVEPARVSVTPSGALELEPARAHDAARYRCRVSVAHAPHLYATSEEVELRINSEAGAAESPPRFVATPQPLTVMEGASVTFDCAAVGNPKPEMSWLNNGVAIDLSDLDSRFYLAGSGSLRVVSARALDAGAYTCRAHNRIDSVDHTTHLHVLTAPRVHLPDGGVVRARARGDVTLRCEARGRPAPAVAWLKDGEPLTPNNHDIALVDGASLRIQGVLRMDAGMFQCAATSLAGSAVGSLRLIVLPPDDEIDAHDLSMQHSKSQNFDPKSFLNSLAAINTSSTYTKPIHKPSYTNSTQDIFNSLISSSPVADHTVDSTPEDADFLGETSSAYTSHPQTEFAEILTLDPDNNLEHSFHAAEGLDLDELGQGNASVVSAPRALRAVIVKHRFVTLSWEEPEDKTEEVTGYAVIYKVKGSERVRVWRGGAGRHEMNVASLHPNTTYQFAVLAYTEHAVSPPAEMIEVHTPEEELSYGPPLSVRVEAAGPHALRVAWSPPAPAPAAAQAPPPLKYTVHYSEAESGREQFQWVDADTASSGTITSTLTGLRAATAYWVRVAAAGGAPGPELRARTPSDVPAAPPANVTAVSTGATSILVRWDAPPPRTHRGALTGYKVRYRALAPASTQGPSGTPPLGTAGGVRRKADSLTTPADARRAELRDLDTATTYQIRVCAINANGSGPFSEWVSAATLHQQRDETSVPPQPPPLTTRAGRDWISVWWSEEGEEGEGGGGGGAASGVLVRGYWLGWGLGVPDEHSRELPRHMHSHVIRGLESNSEYVISLRASNALGLGPPVYATVRTRPAAAEDELGDDEEDDEPGDDEEDDEDDAPPLIPPVGLKVIMLSGTTAVVYWTDPTLPKGQPATDGRRYVVRWASAGARARTFNATDLNCMLDDLKPFTHYEFAVKLIKGGRESSWSMLVSNTSLEAAPGSAPRDLRASPAAPPARAADLVWAPPAKPNGIITGYVIMYAAQRGGGAGGGGGGGGGDEWSALAVLGERTRARVDRLRARTTYAFKVQARNSKGLGPFGPPLQYTTAMESGESAGLATATSAWLWASAGGACAVLALAAALALSLCCRRAQPPLSPDTSTYQKSSASAGIKPPDLWIHHDQMELKHMDKSLHTSAMSGGSVEAANALVSSTLTLSRGGGGGGAEYEPAHGRHAHAHAPPASLDRRHYVPTYVESSLAGSCAGSGSDDTAVLRASPASGASTSAYTCDRCDYRPMTGVGVGVGSMGNMGGMGGLGGMGGMGTMGSMSVGCASTCERRQLGRGHHPDQSTPLLAGMGGMGGVGGMGALGPPALHSPQPSLASLHHQHPPPLPLPPPAPCGSGTCPLGSACSAPGGAAGGGAGSAPTPAGGGSDIYACAARERGHYVAYEPLGHYTHRDSLSSDTGLGSSVGGAHCTGAAPPALGVGGSLQRERRAPPLHSFSDTSDHSTPTHSSRSVRESSPYKKSASSSPGHAPNRLQLGGGGVSACPSELEPLTPSRSTERLAREMQNLEGLMKDLSAITHHQFHC